MRIKWSNLIIVFCSLAILSSSVDAHAQNRQEATVLIYNIAFGGLTSGIGAAINTPKSKNWKASFIRGFWQGSIGGVATYGGKKSLYLINKHENLVFAWPAKLLHAAGSSVISNAASNRPFLSNWHIDFGLVRFDFSIGETKGFNARLLPMGVYGIIMGSRDSRFDLTSTLLTGNIAFRHKEEYIQVNSRFFKGYSYARSFVYVNDSTRWKITAHEMVHLFQHNEYQVFNSWFYSLQKTLKPTKLKFVFTNFVYPDLPYHALFYELEGRHEFRNYYRNFFEFEAERFSTNATVEY